MKGKELIDRLEETFGSIPSLSEWIEQIEQGTFAQYSAEQNAEWHQLAEDFGEYLSNIPVWIPSLLLTTDLQREGFIELCAQIQAEPDKRKAGALAIVLRRALIAPGVTKIPISDVKNNVVAEPPKQQIRFVIFFMVEIYRKATGSKARAINLVSETTKMAEMPYISSEKIWRWYDKGPAKYRREKQLAVAIIEQWDKFAAPILKEAMVEFLANVQMTKHLAKALIFTPEEYEQLHFTMSLANTVFDLPVKISNWQKSIDIEVNNGGHKLDLEELWQEEGAELFDLEKSASSAA